MIYFRCKLEDVSFEGQPEYQDMMSMIHGKHVSPMTE